ncbi:unnamed protein product [Rhizophagus irregularis]|nr:unnamed protein product [Rhizophagus irregularis]
MVKHVKSSLRIASGKCARGDVTSPRRESNSNVEAGRNCSRSDFGISSLTPTSTTAMVGTIPYMAPDVVLVDLIDLMIQKLTSGLWDAEKIVRAPIHHWQSQLIDFNFDLT